MQCFCKNLADQESKDFAKDKLFDVKVRKRDENGNVYVEVE
jgi:hypothetical protein